MKGWESSFFWNTWVSFQGVLMERRWEEEWRGMETQGERTIFNGRRFSYTYLCEAGTLTYFLPWRGIKQELCVSWLLFLPCRGKVEEGRQGGRELSECMKQLNSIWVLDHLTSRFFLLCLCRRCPLYSCVIFPWNSISRVLWLSQVGLWKSAGPCFCSLLFPATSFAGKSPSSSLEHNDTRIW